LLSFNKATNGISAIGRGAIPNNPFGPGWAVVAAGDFNGDGHLDLAYRNTTSATTEMQFLNGTNNGILAIGGGIVALG
jgi:hypothetical protein